MQKSKKQAHKLANYVGSLKHGRMEGVGTYCFDTGSVYEGEFMDGMFHGEGVLTFDNGVKYIGKWVKGKTTEGQLTFKDGLAYVDDQDLLTGWRYCNRVWDRRFFREIVDSSESCEEYPVNDIPDYAYDTGDGYYDPAARSVFRYQKDIIDARLNEGKILPAFLRFVREDEHAWILAKCRKGFDAFAGDPRVDNRGLVATLSQGAGASAAKKNGSFAEKYPTKQHPNAVFIKSEDHPSFSQRVLPSI